MYDVGLRVIRGPDWHWDDQDGGEGFVGTVTEFSPKTAPDKTAVVVWDVGYRTNYRIGYDDAYDLRIFDNATIGVNHPEIMCNGCNKRNFSGMRFKCCVCYDYDLCFQCYMNDCHDLLHIFYRFDINSHSGAFKLPSREGSRKIYINGIFPGAKVVRGQNWDWDDQDGGTGCVGYVTHIRGWDVETDRSVASVKWVKSGVTNVYRVGHKGKIDIKCVKAVKWGQCYVDHLPVLGELSLLSLRTSQEVIVNFSSGDRVRVTVNEEELKNLQSGHGGWNPRMVQCIGKIGVVHRVTDRGDVRVQFDNCTNRWTLHPQALVKINGDKIPTHLKIGDKVEIISDVARVRELQKGHGEWLDIMAADLGKTGEVTKIYSDGDLRVDVGDQAWTLNPLCVRKVREIDPSESSNKSLDRLRNIISSISEEIQDLELTDETSFDNLVKEVERGNLEFLNEYFMKSRSQDDLPNDGKTCLHIASYKGQLKLVQFLLTVGGAPEAQDSEGDTALHYAVYGNQPAVIELLLNHGMNVNAVNKSGCSALHIAVNRQFRQCVVILLQFQADPNLKDLFGDTVLHHVVGKGDLDFVNLLISNSEIDFSIVNHGGFNIIQTCALKGHDLIMERLLQKSVSLVDVKKDDGFAAIHLAALNGYDAVARILLLKGNSNINLKNGRNQTPLHLAASQKRFSVVELLIQLGADVNAIDENGDSPLLLALSTKTAQAPTIDFNPEEAPNIFKMYVKLKNANADVENGLFAALIAFLLESKSSIKKSNKQGITPLHLIKQGPLFDVFKSVPEFVPLLLTKDDDEDALSSYEASRGTPPEIIETHESVQDTNCSDIDLQSARVECVVCSELADNVTFVPCGHEITCEECSSRMKKCIKCGMIIMKRVARDGRSVVAKSRHRSADRLRYLENKIAEIEEVHCCPICMEHRRNVVFLCGHGACDHCSETLTMCHMCRTVITQKINLY